MLIPAKRSVPALAGGEFWGHEAGLEEEEAGAEEVLVTELTVERLLDEDEGDEETVVGVIVCDVNGFDVILTGMH